MESLENEFKNCKNYIFFFSKNFSKSNILKKGIKFFFLTFPHEIRITVFLIVFKFIAYTYIEKRGENLDKVRTENFDDWWMKEHFQ